MNRMRYTAPLALFGIIAFRSLGQTPPPGQPPRPNADPYANNPDAGQLKFPLAAPAGKDTGAIKTSPPGATNIGPFDAPRGSMDRISILRPTRKSGIR
jgi:hypothetical protein